MRILILNWRDINNPLSGGAEILTHEIAKRLVALGNHVVHFRAFLFYQREKGKFDVVRDEVHGIPFFLPLAM